MPDHGAPDRDAKPRQNPARPATELPVKERFDPRVLAFESGDGRGRRGSAALMALNDELHRLEKQQGVADPNTVVFYCARIQEVTTKRAMEFTPRSLGVGKPTGDNCANLDALLRRRVIPRTTATWAHGIRSLGNAARHLTKPLTRVDADLAVAFLEGYLHWFFCEFQFQVAAYKSEGLLVARLHPPAFAAHREVVELVRTLDSLEGSGDSPEQKNARLNALVDRARSDGEIFSRSYWFAASTAEKLLAANREEEAREVLGIALRFNAQYEQIARIRQLMGLYHIRQGELDEAERWLTCDPARDEIEGETRGLLGSLCKQRYLEELNRSGSLLRANHWLEKSHAAYAQGWGESEGTNYYLGINVAATALWTGRLPHARTVSETIIKRLGHIRRQIDEVHDEIGAHFDLWDELTLLEALLIRGDYERVHAELRRMMTTYRSRDLGVFLDQARRNMRALRELGETSLQEDFLEHEWPSRCE